MGWEKVNLSVEQSALLSGAGVPANQARYVTRIRRVFERAVREGDWDLVGATVATGRLRLQDVSPPFVEALGVGYTEATGAAVRSTLARYYLNDWALIGAKHSDWLPLYFGSAKRGDLNLLVFLDGVASGIAKNEHIHVFKGFVDGLDLSQNRRLALVEALAGSHLDAADHLYGVGARFLPASLRGEVLSKLRSDDPNVIRWCGQHEAETACEDALIAYVQYDFQKILETVLFDPVARNSAEIPIASLVKPLRFAFQLGKVHLAPTVLRAAPDREQLVDAVLLEPGVGLAAHKELLRLDAMSPCQMLRLKEQAEARMAENSDGADERDYAISSAMSAALRQNDLLEAPVYTSRGQSTMRTTVKTTRL